eukprot:549111-Hanusia_phi.AAC.1
MSKLAESRSRLTVGPAAGLGTYRRLSLDSESGPGRPTGPRRTPASEDRTPPLNFRSLLANQGLGDNRRGPK